MKIRTRLTWWYAGILIVSLLVMGVWTFREISEQLRHEHRHRPEGRALGEAGEMIFQVGLPAVVLGLLGGWWLTLVAVYLGVSQAALDAACDYAHERVPSVLGTPLSGQASTQQWIGEMQVLVSAARALLYDTTRAFMHAPLDDAANRSRLAAVKYAVTNTACRVTDIGLRVAGGFSLTRRLPLERHFRDARGGLFQPPQDDLALALVGRTALDARRAGTASFKPIG